MNTPEGLDDTEANGLVVAIVGTCLGHFLIHIRPGFFKNSLNLTTYVGYSKGDETACLKKK